MSLALGKPEAGKLGPAGPPDSAFRPPTLGPMRGWSFCRGPTGSVAESADLARVPGPKVRRAPPRQHLGETGSQSGRSLPEAPPPPPRRLFPLPSLPSPREGGGDSAALPWPSRRRPQPARCPLRPAAAGRTSGARGSPAEVSGGGSAGGGKPPRPRNSLQAVSLRREEVG